MALVVSLVAFYAAVSAAVTISSDLEPPVRREAPVRRQLELGLSDDGDEPLPMNLAQVDGPTDADGEAWPEGLAEAKRQEPEAEGLDQGDAHRNRKIMRERYEFYKQACMKDKAGPKMHTELCARVRIEYAEAVHNDVDMTEPIGVETPNGPFERAFRKTLRAHFYVEKEQCKSVSVDPRACVQRLHVEFAKAAAQGPKWPTTEGPAADNAEWPQEFQPTQEAKPQPQPQPQQPQPQPQPQQPQPQQQAQPQPQPPQQPVQAPPAEVPPPRKHVAPPQKHAPKPVADGRTAAPVVATAPRPSTTTTRSVLPIVAGVLGLGLIIGTCLWWARYMKDQPETY